MGHLTIGEATDSELHKFTHGQSVFFEMERLGKCYLPKGSDLRLLVSPLPQEAVREGEGRQRTLLTTQTIYLCHLQLNEYKSLFNLSF